MPCGAQTASPFSRLLSRDKLFLCTPFCCVFGVSTVAALDQLGRPPPRPASLFYGVGFDSTAPVTLQDQGLGGCS
jgi:hypothetical protein